MKKQNILKQNNLDLLCQLGSEFLRGLGRIGVDIISVSDTELKRVITKMIVDNDAAIQLNKDRLKERKRLQDEKK